MALITLFILDHNFSTRNPINVSKDSDFSLVSHKNLIDYYHVAHWA